MTSALFVDNVVLLQTKDNKLNALIYSTMLNLSVVQGYLSGYQNDLLYFVNKSSTSGGMLTCLYLPLVYIQLLVSSRDQSISQDQLSILKELGQDLNLVNKLARYLEQINKPAEALAITTDTSHKFDLAIQCKELSIALEMIVLDPNPEKYKLLAQVALADWRFDIAEECLLKGNDLDHLLMLYSNQGNTNGLKKLSSLAIDHYKYQIAFTSSFILNDFQSCLDILITSKMMGEACLFAKQYVPDRVLDTVQHYKQQLSEEAAGATGAILVKRLQEDVPYIENTTTHEMEIDNMMRLKQHNKGTHSESMEVNTTGTQSVIDEEEKKRKSPQYQKKSMEDELEDLLK